MDMKTNLSRIRTATLLAVCVLALSPVAMFAKATEERGRIKAVDNTAHQIVVTDQKTKADVTFKWNAQTKFIEQGKAVKATALKAGVPVHLTYAPSSGTPTLERVKLSPDIGQKYSPLSRSGQPKY